LPVAPHGVRERTSILDGHDEIRDHDIGVNIPYQLETTPAVLGFVHLVSELAEEFDPCRSQTGLVFDEDNHVVRLVLLWPGAVAPLG
jgi:hypothetical protein